MVVLQFGLQKMHGKFRSKCWANTGYVRVSLKYGWMRSNMVGMDGSVEMWESEVGVSKKYREDERGKRKSQNSSDDDTNGRRGGKWEGGEMR